MTTDFSQAIVNGFGIAAKWREMGQQEERMRLDESYRRDAMSENRRQFDLGLKETTTARNQKDKRVGEQLEVQRGELASRNRYYRDSVEIDRKKLGLTERAMNEEKDLRDRAEENAYIGQLALMKFERERAGNPMSEQEQLQYFAGNPIGRRALKRARLPTESVRDGTPFDAAVTGPDGSVTVAGKRKDGSVAIPDQGRTHDNKTPPFTMAPGNVTTLVTGAIMQSPEGIAAARQHAALTSGKKELEMTEAEIQQALVAANADATARYNAAKEAEAKVQTTQPNLAQPPAASEDPVKAGLARAGEGVADLGAQFTTPFDPNRSIGEQVGERVRRGTGDIVGIASDIPTPFSVVGGGVKNFGAGLFGLGGPSPTQQSATPARPPLQPPAPITELRADNPLMQRRASLLQQQEEASRFSRGLAMGYTPEQAGVYSATGTPSESVASAQIRELGDLGRRAEAAAVASDKQIEAGYKAISSTIDGMAKGDEWLESQRGAMTRIMSMSNVTTRGALGADPDMRAQYANNLVTLMRMGDNFDGVDPRYKNDILGAMAMKSINATSDSGLDVNNPEQVKQVSENLNTLYRGVPEGISPKQQALLADLAASDWSSEEMAVARDEIIRGTPDKVDQMFQQTFR